MTSKKKRLKIKLVDQKEVKKMVKVHQLQHYNGLGPKSGLIHALSLFPTHQNLLAVANLKKNHWTFQLLLIAHFGANDYLEKQVPFQEL